MNFNQVVELVDAAKAKGEQGVRVQIDGRYPYDFLVGRMIKQGNRVELIKRFKNDVHDCVVYFGKEQ